MRVCIPHRSQARGLNTLSDVAYLGGIRPSSCVTNRHILISPVLAGANAQPAVSRTLSVCKSAENRVSERSGLASRDSVVRVFDETGQLLQIRLDQLSELGLVLGQLGETLETEGLLCRRDVGG